MKNNKGAIAIGINHTGMQNGLNVVEALKENGFKKGDKVAFEMSEQNIHEIKEIIKSKEKTKYIIYELNNELNQMKEKIKKAKFKKNSVELKQYKLQKKELEYAVNESLFLIPVFDFLFSNKAVIIPLRGKTNFAERAIKFEHKSFSSRKNKRFFDFFKIPVQEKLFKKNLKGKNPKFVLTGWAHLSAVKKMIYCRKTIDLSRMDFPVTTALKINEWFIRKRYQIHTAKKKKIRKQLTKRKL